MSVSCACLKPQLVIISFQLEKVFKGFQSLYQSVQTKKTKRTHQEALHVGLTTALWKVQSCNGWCCPMTCHLIQFLRNTLKLQIHSLVHLFFFSLRPLLWKIRFLRLNKNPTTSHQLQFNFIFSSVRANSACFAPGSTAKHPFFFHNAQLEMHLLEGRV